eukprot:gene14868-9656_t
MPYVRALDETPMRSQAEATQLALSLSQEIAGRELAKVRAENTLYEALQTLARGVDQTLQGLITNKTNWTADLGQLMPDALDRMVAVMTEGQTKTFTEVRRMLDKLSEQCPDLRKEQRTYLRRIERQVEKAIQTQVPEDPNPPVGPGVIRAAAVAAVGGVEPLGDGVVGEDDLGPEQ